MSTFTQVSNSFLVYPNFGGLINKFRNPSMDIWQRGTSAITVTTAGAYTADGWIVTPTGASCTAAASISNIRTGSLSYYSMLITGATSVTDITLKQRIESYIAAQLESQVITVQAQVYNNTGGSITPTLTVKHPTAQDNYTSTSTDVSAVSLQACANAVWTQISYTFTASTSVNGMEITIDFGNNFSTNGKSVQVTELDIRATPGVSVGLNSTPPTPEVRPVQSEMSFSQRYYFRHTSTNLFTSYGKGITNGTAGNINSFCTVLPVTMRAAPTVTTSNLIIYDGTASNATINGFAASYNTINMISFDATTTGGSGYTSARPASVIGSNSGTSYLDASAEL